MDIIETEPVATPKEGLRRRVAVQRVSRSPEGSVTVLEEHYYNFRPTPQGAMETDKCKKNRCRAKREARQNAWDKFDEEKLEEKRKKRTKGAAALRARHSMHLTRPPAMCCAQVNSP